MLNLRIFKSGINVDIKHITSVKTTANIVGLNGTTNGFKLLFDICKNTVTPYPVILPNIDDYITSSKPLDLIK